MDIIEKLEILDCPICHGPAILEEEKGWSYYVTCADCGCHTADSPFSKNSERFEAAKKAVTLWNMGKVVSSDPGE